MVTFPIQIIDGDVWLELPSVMQVEKLVGADRLRRSCHHGEASPVTEQLLA